MTSLSMTSLRLIYAKHLFLKGCRDDRVNLVEKSLEMTQYLNFSDLKEQGVENPKHKLKRDKVLNFINGHIRDSKNKAFDGLRYGVFEEGFLVMATRSGAAKVVDYLIKKGLAFDAQNALGGSNSLDFSILHQQWTCAGLLMEAGMEPNTSRVKIDESVHEKIEKAMALFVQEKLKEVVPMVDSAHLKRRL